MSNAPIDLGQMDKIAASTAEIDNILKELLDQSRLDLTQMQAALRDGDIREAGRVAHRIKGAARMVGAYPLAAVCEIMDAAGKEGRLHGEGATQMELQRLIGWLQEHLGGAREGA
jgi:HPt (histidine-containing phosphotransfer) domain-containing protein